MDSCSVQAMCGGHHQFFFHPFLYASTTGILQEGSHVGTAFISFHFGLFGPSFPFILAFWAFNPFFLSFGPWFLFFLASWDRMDLCAFMYQKGIAKVSLRVSLWDWRKCGEKKEHFQALHATMNELIVFQDIARSRFWAPFKKKERLTRRLLHEEFSRFLKSLRSNDPSSHSLCIIKCTSLIHKYVTSCSSPRGWDPMTPQWNNPLWGAKSVLQLWCTVSSSDTFCRQTSATWSSISRWCRQTNFTELAMISCFLISNLGTGLIPKLFKSEGFLDLATKTYKDAQTHKANHWDLISTITMTSMGPSAHWVSLARHRRVIYQSSLCS